MLQLRILISEFYLSCFELICLNYLPENLIIIIIIIIIIITIIIILTSCELGSSVYIVSGCGPDDRAIEVRSLAKAKGFFL
jgi:hypothetical protein